MGSPTLRVRPFDRDAPCRSVRPKAERTHFAVDPDKGVFDPVIAKCLGQPVDPVALGDAVQIQRDAGGLAHVVAVQLQNLMRRAARGLHRCTDAIGRGGLRPEAPGRHRVPHAGVEGPARGAPDLEAEAQDVSKALGHRHPLAHRRRVDPHQVAVGLPGRHLSVHFVHGRLQRGADRVGVDARLCVEQCRPTRAHRRAVQSDGRALSRHLRHTAPPPSELPA